MRRRRGTLEALVRVELRRCALPLRNGLVLAAAGTALLAVIAPERRDLLAFPSGAAAFGLVFAVAFAGVRDRMDLGLAFVQSLPVSASLAAAARMVAVVIVCAGASGLGTTALWIAAPTQPPVALGPPLYAAIALGAWVALSAVGCLAAAVLLRFSQARLQLVPPVLAVGLVALTVVPDDALPPLEALRRLLASRWFLPAASTAFWALALLTGWLAHALLTAAIRDFRPERDRIEW